MTRKELFSGSIGGLAASALVLSTHLALAQPAKAVNAAPLPAASTAATASFADIISRVAPAVVSVDVERTGRATPAALDRPGLAPFGGAVPFGDLRRFFEQMPEGRFVQPRRGAGSGFFVSADGYIVTNNHVVEGADKITIRTSDDRTLDARLVGRDPATDLAVVKVQGGDFPFVSFEDRAKPRVGDWVVAVGNPFNLGGTATAGIVSALGRSNISGSSYVDYMQIDAPINRGNSGGPTFDLRGRVVGVNTAIFSPNGGSVGIGFDIPADVAAKVTRELIETGRVTRGYIGATVQDVNAEIAESLGVEPRSGALVAEVSVDGPASRAGLRQGDVVTRVNGEPVRTAADLTRQVGLARPGARITLSVLRDGRQQAVDVMPGLRPDEQQLASNDVQPQAGAAGGLGLMVAPNPSGGLRVEGVAPGSEAARQGLRAGDVIKEVAGSPARTPEDIRSALAEAKSSGKRAVLLLAQRNGRNIYLAVRPAGLG